ncbi:transposase, partial [Zestomonas thermotolerans]|uniref:transposase n=1 Tax=Zestomonas thermotolerans TaxID=157784 RepID=UPI00200A362A
DPPGASRTASLVRMSVRWITSFDRDLKAKAQVRAKVEHPFRVIKRQFGYTKVRFRGLAKNTAQLITLFALSNLWMARRHLLANTGEVRL